MKTRECPVCGSKLVKVIGSNISCTNEDCENYISDEYEWIFVDYHNYKDYEDFDIRNIGDDVESEYNEEYDKYLFFADRKDYISRFEYRKMNNFTEDYIFKNNKINVPKRYLEDDEIDNLKDIEIKYNYMKEGRDLEKTPKEALIFYRRFLNHKLFRNDYYIYKKLVKLEKDPEKQLDLIVTFFNKGIYCNRYHYLWFLKKLYLLSKKIYISNEVVDECLKEFKNNGFHKKKFSDDPVPIAEKITVSRDILKVRTNEEYTLRQYKYEISEEASNLNAVNQLEYATNILESLILNKGFKGTRIFEKICNNYHRLKNYKEELKWIFGFFSKTRKFGNQKYWSFVERLNKLTVETNDFYHNELFFDNNDYYLTSEDFKQNPMKFYEITDYISLVKEKYSMIIKGQKLENDNINDAIDYYNSILNHKLFKNDYYVYKSLVILYTEIGDFEEALETIISFLNSGIYCDRYNYLLFLLNLKNLSQNFVVKNEELNKCLNSFKEKSFKNKYLENTPVPLAERLVFKNNEIKVIPGKDFEAQQEMDALDLELRLFESYGMFESMNEIFKIMINDYDLEDIELYKQMCYNCQELNDVEGEKRIIKTYLDRNNGWNISEEKQFKKRLEELENSKKGIIPLKEPRIEIFYENNINYLSHSDFKNNDVGFTELVDKIIEKFNIRSDGWKFEFDDYDKAIEYYTSLLNHYLFKDDYYVYRKLVIQYEKINEYEMMWKTIKSFFASGINCDRYQYIWFLHKIENISKVMFISDEEINICLKNFKENGFKNKNVESVVFLAERLYKYKFSLKINSPKIYRRTQKKYELTEESNQLDINGSNEEATEILRNLVENGCNRHPRDFMRLCHMYRGQGDLKNELEIINLYLSSGYKYSNEWFEDRLKEVNDLIEKNS